MPNPKGRSVSRKKNALQDRVLLLLRQASRTGKQAVPEAFQGVTKGRIEAVLKAIDRSTPDIVDAVFALLDDQNDSWFSNAPEGAKLCHGATTAHVGAHVGILQRSGSIKLDREGRDYWIKPLRELGAIEAIYLDPVSMTFYPGHIVAKSPNCAYRLENAFKRILQADEKEWPGMLKAWVREDMVRERAELQARIADESRQFLDTKHSDLIESACTHYVPRFLPGYAILYVDDGDGDRITKEDCVRLKGAGITISLSDSMPDVLLWNRDTNNLWVIEAVTSDGEVDEQKISNLRKFAEKHGKMGIGFTTVYRSWRDTAARQGKYKNIAPGSYVWILEDPSKHFLAESFPLPPRTIVSSIIRSTSA